MIGTLKKIIGISSINAPATEMDSVEAYDIWAETYDTQPGNLMLDLDEQVFSGLLKGVEIENKLIADIGCGTGRHWPRLFECKPAGLTGFDVSKKMLDRLQEKFLQAYTVQIQNNLFSTIADSTFDVIVSTLTVAHIENLEEALQAWSRILKSKGDIIITDFHPDALAAGGKRTFEHHKTQIAVQNFVHSLPEIERVLLKNDFHIVRKDERAVDEMVRHYYVAKKALHVYDKFKGRQIIYGIHLKRG